MARLRAGDVISGQEGKAVATIDGMVYDLFYIKEIEATMEKQKAEVKTIGRRGTQHKSVGWSGSGSMTVYYVTTKFRKLMEDYAKKGKDVYFNIMVVNNDPTSSIGVQTVVLHGCNVNSVVLTKLNAESEVLDDSMDFTFEDFDVLTSFNTPAF